MFKTFEGLTTKDWPCLKAKAYNARVVVAWLAEKTYESAHLDGEHGRLRSVCIWGFAEFFYLIEREPRHLSDEGSARLIRAGNAFLQCYGALAADCHQSGDALYYLIPKHHAVAHTLLDLEVERYNARFYQCYSDEDFVGRMKRIAIRCHPRTMAKRAMQRYLIGVGVKWRRIKLLKQGVRVKKHSLKRHVIPKKMY